MISSFSKNTKQKDQNKLSMKNDDESNRTMNVNESELKTVRFVNSESKNKDKNEAGDRLIILKIKNVKLADVLY